MDVNLYDRILQERISSEEQLSATERELLARDPASRSLIEENRLLELARPRAWQAPVRSQMLRNVYQNAPRNQGILSNLHFNLSPQRARSLLAGSVALIAAGILGLHLWQYGARWQRSDGFEVRYHLLADPGNDLAYFSRQLAGEAQRIGGDEFRGADSSVELLSLEKDAGGELYAVLRLKDVSPEDLAHFDREFSDTLRSERTSIRNASWYRVPSRPGLEYESRLMTINERQMRYPQEFSLNEALELDALLKAVGEDEVLIRNMSIGDGSRFELGEVVTLQQDDLGNVTISNTAADQPALQPMDYRELVERAEP
ncbi:hypothetical protein KDL44_15835 [bacterium]|nr:hypothetical protein [bacterium]